MGSDKEAPPAMAVLDPETKNVRLMAELCGVCFFAKDNPQKLAEGVLEKLVAEARERDGHLMCVRTITMNDNVPISKPAMCRGFYLGYRTLTVKLAQIAGLLLVEEPEDDPSKNHR